MNRHERRTNAARLRQGKPIVTRLNPRKLPRETQIAIARARISEAVREALRDFQGEVNGATLIEAEERIRDRIRPMLIEPSMMPVISCTRHPSDPGRMVVSID